MLAQQVSDSLVPGLTEAEEQQLLIAAGALVVALLLDRFVLRRLYVPLVRWLGTLPLLEPLAEHDAFIGRWIDRLMSIILVTSGVIAAIAISGTNIDGLTEQFQDAGWAVSKWFAVHIPRIAIILVIAYLARNAVMRLAPSMIRNTLLRGKRGVERDEAAKRGTSLVAVIGYAVTGLVVLLAGVTVMSELGLNTGPLLASIGIVGIAVGFGSQHLVRDIIAGTFVLAEDQYRVGDVASVGGKTGLVEAVNLRRTVLRDLDGIFHIVPKGEITIASNYTKTFSRVNLNVSVAYKEDMATSSAC